MVKVKMLVSRTNADIGAVIEVSSAEAERMIAADQAVIVREEKKVEKAVSRSRPEKAKRG